MRNYENVVRVVALSQALVQGRKVGRYLRADTLLEGTPIKDVVVTAKSTLDSPPVPEEGDRLPRHAVPAYGLAHVLPLEVIHRGVMVGHAVAVEPGVFPRVAIRCVDRTPPLCQPGVRVRPAQ